MLNFQINIPVPWNNKYTERKKKRNTNNNWIYFHNFFTTWKSNQWVIMKWEIINLSFESRHKAEGQIAVAWDSIFSR